MFAEGAVRASAMPPVYLYALLHRSDFLGGRAKKRLPNKKAPAISGASLVLHKAVYAFVSTHCCSSTFHACPTSQDSDASLLWLSHPSAKANGAERTKANSDAVIVFIAFSLCL